MQRLGLITYNFITSINLLQLFGCLQSTIRATIINYNNFKVMPTEGKNKMDVA